MSVSYECKECGAKMTSIMKNCPKCGSDKRKISVTIKETITLRNGIKGKIKDASGRKKLEFIKREKLSKHGKEAKEELIIDVEGNRKYHEVKEKDSTGKYKTVHRHDEKLKKGKGKKSHKAP